MEPPPAHVFFALALCQPRRLATSIDHGWMSAESTAAKGNYVDHETSG
jgi:hypothetical protein